MMLARISLVLLCVLPESQLSSLLKNQWKLLYGFKVHIQNMSFVQICLQKSKPT
jgi:hypothetical protein